MSQKTDIWSLGVVLFEVLFKKSPWGEEIKEKLDKSQILALIEEKLTKNPAFFFPETKREIPEEFKFLLISMLKYNDAERVGFSDLSSNPLFIEKPLKSLINSTKNPMKTSEEFKELDISPKITRIPLNSSNFMEFSKQIPDFHPLSQSSSKKSNEFFQSESTQKLTNSMRNIDNSSRIDQTLQITPRFLPMKQFSVNFPSSEDFESSRNRFSFDNRPSLEYHNFPDPSLSKIEQMIASLNLRYIPYKTIKKGPLIKAGGFGKVFQATINTVEYAIKEISNVSSEFINKVLREAHNLKNYENPRLVKIYGISYRKLLYDTEESLVLYLVSELKLGDLQMAIMRKTLSFAQKLKISYQIAQGICHLHNHENPLVHADLKPSNILFDESFNAFITDLGISKAIIGKDITCSQAFSAGYAAPEQINPDISGFKITIKTDIWALGLVYYYLFYEKTVNMEFLFGRNSLVIAEIDEELKGIGKLIEKMVVFDSGKRISIEEVLENIVEISEKQKIGIRSIRL